MEKSPQAGPVALALTALLAVGASRPAQEPAGLSLSAIGTTGGGLRARGASTAEHLEFAHAPGGSDLLLARDMREAAGQQDTAAHEWPANLSEAQLDSAYEPLIYVMTAEEQGVYSSLPVEAKRKWLRQFWGRRDPSPGTVRNEERERFYAAIADVDRRFREGGAWAIPGWRTDRGRIFIKYGPPDEVLVRHVPTGVSPYEIWKYTRNRSLRYVFMDLTRFGNYRLIYTDDRREPSRPDWQELLGPDGLKDLQQIQ